VPEKSGVVEAVEEEEILIGTMLHVMVLRIVPPHQVLRMSRRHLFQSL